MSEEYVSVHCGLLLVNVVFVYTMADPVFEMSGVFLHYFYAHFVSSLSLLSPALRSMLGNVTE